MRMVLLLALSLHVYLVASDGKSAPEGRVTGRAGVPLDRLQVQLRCPTTREFHRTWVRSDGEFSFGKMDDGVYELEVLAQNGEVIVRDLVTLPARMSLTVALPDSTVPRGPVSIHRLTHEVPGAAVKAFRRAVNAAREKDEAATVQHLDRALELDPDFIDALHRRGLYAFSQRDFMFARRLLSRAAQLDSASPAIQADAAMAEYAAASYPECERFAAAAIRLDPANPKSNYLLALALLQLGRPPDRAVPHLEKAASLFPRAGEILSLIRQHQERALTLK